MPKLDLRDETFMDGSGPQAVQRARQHLAAAGGRLVPQHPSDSVRSVLGALDLEATPT